MLTDCTTGPEAGRKCVHPSRIITLAETIHYRNGYGAGDEARTRYLHLGKVALYRMSYTRMGRALLYHKHEICQAQFSLFEKTVLPPEKKKLSLLSPVGVLYQSLSLSQ